MSAPPPAASVEGSPTNSKGQAAISDGEVEPDDPLVGATLGGYRVGKRLGRGGMGTVYRATQLSLGRAVALKALDTALAADPEFSERFRREARAAAQLDHPHVVQPIDFYEAEGRLLFAMELMEGGSAAERIEAGRRFVERDAVDIGIAVARALEYAEQIGIVHRDLKPANILFSKHGTPKVADMGLVLDRVREESGDASPLTRAGFAQGTPEYMSPEQARGRRDLDVRSDIYSLGVTLFEMLSGRRPFYGPDGMAVALQHCTAPMPDVRTLAPDVTPRLSAVIARATAKRREDRYRSGEEMRKALEATRADVSLAHEGKELPGRATRARVGLRLESVEELDLSRGRFALEAVLTVGWRGARDASLVRLLAAETISREEIARVEEGSWRRVALRVRARARVDATDALAAYPYDAHALRLEVEHPDLGAEDLILLPDLERTSVASALAIAGFTIERRLRAEEIRAVPAGAGEVHGGLLGARGNRLPILRSRLIFELRIRRRLGPYWLRVGTPHALSLALALAAPWSEYPILGAALAIGASLLGDLVASRHAPETGVVTVADLHASLGRAAALWVMVCECLAHVIVVATGAGHGWAAVNRALGFSERWILPAAALLAASLLGFPAGKPLVLSRVVRARRRDRLTGAPTSLEETIAERPQAGLRSAREQLTVGLLHEPSRLVEGCVTTIDQLVTRFLTEGPVEYDARLNLVPRLAEEVPSFENGRMEAVEDGGLRVRWRLKRGLRWGDGSPVVPEDALAAHALRPMSGLSTRGAGIRVESGEVVVEYDAPRPGAVVDLRLFPSTHLERFKGEEGAKRMADGALPPLAGPFLLARWDRGREILLERNPHYLHGPAALSSVRIRVFKSRQALENAFAAREVQLVPEGVLEPGAADALARRVPGAIASRRAAPNAYFLLPNHDHPVLADRRVRQALLLAIDREALVRVALDGYGRVAHGWLPPHHEGHWDHLPHHAYDPERAAKLLDEAGLRPGKDGRRRGPDGKPISLEVARAERHPQAPIDYVGGAAWGPLGIGVTTTVHSEEEYFRGVLLQRRFPALAYLGYTVDPWETGRELWSEDRIPSAENRFVGRNFTGWRSAAATELHQRIDRCRVDEERLELYERQQRLWVEELPWLPLYRPEQSLLLGPGLAGIASHAGGDHQLPWNAEEWRFTE